MDKQKCDGMKCLSDVVLDTDRRSYWLQTLGACNLQPHAPNSRAQTARGTMLEEGPLEES
jgi:hypothetical protein